MSSAQQPLSLKHTEAQERAALLDVTAYDVVLDLDRGEETFGSVSTITVRSQGGRTFVEVQPVTLNAVTVNGKAVDVTRLERGRVPIETDPGENVVMVDAVMRYRHDGEGLHRSIDPADGRHYVYAMTFLDAAPSIFGCFDQPDLKAVWNLQVRAPREWVVLGNSPATQVEPGSWVLAQTLPLSTYLVALVAGPYHVVRKEHDGIPLGLSARASIARQLDDDAEEIFTVTAQSFDELHRLFGVRYPFGDYHQAFVPEFNAGAMESAGCVTFRDPLIFQSRALRTQHVVRASTIVHEMAHMWFGDLVTPVWWDDLWLNESFAEYVGARVTADATEFTEVWVTEAYTRRPWGLAADQRPSTHPVAGNGAADGATALQNFDGISYAKGATIIKQLHARLGDEVFFGGVSDHFEKHRFGNATMADLLDSWERAGAGDLSTFSDGWLLTAGPDRIQLDRAGGVLLRTPLEGHPADRDHTLGLATAAASSPGVWTIEPVRLDADAVAVDVPDGPVVPDPHAETWAVTLLDAETVAALPEVLPATTDALVRASIWCSVRNAFQHALVSPDAVLDLLEVALPAEDTDDGVGQTLGWAVWDVASNAADPVAALARVHDVAARCVSGAEPGGSLQLAALQIQVAAADDADMLRDWLASGDSLPDGVVVDLELRWRILLRLAKIGGVDRDRLAAALAEETTAVLAGRARQGRRRFAGRRGQGLGVAAVHRRGRGAQLRARGDRPRPLAGRSGASHRTVRCPLLRRGARHHPGTQQPDAGGGDQRLLPALVGDRGHRRPGARSARSRRRRLDHPPRAGRRDVGPGAQAGDPTGVRSMTDLGARPRRPGPTVRTRVTEHGDGSERRREDQLATEEPLEIRVAWPGSPAQRVWVTMRTPGHDFELSAGFSCHEAIATPSSIRGIAYCTDVDLTPEQELNVVTVTLTGPTDIGHRHAGLSAGSSACGVCGKDSVTEVLDSVRGVRTAWTGPLPHPDVVRRLPDSLREGQAVFSRTGGVHAAGLFTAEGERLVVREDVGRHNAVDKVTGARVLAGVSPAEACLVVSGRAGFELVQKAVAAGVGSLVAVGAPTSLAVSLAREAGLALFGFTSPERTVRYA